MVENVDKPSAFKLLVAELFSLLGFHKVVVDYVYAGELWHDYDIDLMYGEKGDVSVAEVKYYRIDSPPRSDLVIAALQSVRHLKNATHAQKCALVMSCQLNSNMAPLVAGYHDVDVWDLGRIFSSAQPYPDLFRKLAVALEIDVDRAAQYAGTPIQPVNEDEQPLKKGRLIADILTNLPTGHAHYTDFEEACITALKYLFDQDLTGWHEQHRSHDGHHRRDLVCRTLPNAELWKLILSDLKSRYVVFEFKNYSSEVKEAEVNQAEKYLYPVALRCVAFIISPNGLSQSALSATYGAMRENGKMIISITSQELVQMLVGKDEGTDPNVEMFRLVDALLMGLGR